MASGEGTLMEQDQAFRLVCESIDVVNRQLPSSRRLQKDPRTVIAGSGGSLDSLGLINFAATRRSASTGTRC